MHRPPPKRRTRGQQLLQQPRTCTGRSSGRCLVQLRSLRRARLGPMTSDKPKVSVIIPTHNRAALLQRAVRSVTGQTFADLEVMIVDDASNDGTQDLVASWADRRIRYLRHPVNKGV